ncbi:Ig-like domain-containing protein [Edaphobacter bradus]|uniref:Ig-like domain-containing protein n=1 Tax=Edaphobacter bradus TaxID=2259016 RepID=UPI0021E09311|nr:Ig-like domain-containing protein [Edaphobacter bradus]
MFALRRVSGLLLVGLALSIVGCDNSGLDSVQVTPATQTVTVGQTAQFTAVGTYGSVNHHTTKNLTSEVSWASTVPAVATVNSSGLVTAVGSGVTTITASAMAYNGHVSSSAILTVTSSAGGGTGGSGGGILSLTIIPSGIVFGSLTQSGQFLAIGTFSSAPTVRDLTNSVKWLTSAPNVFPVTNYSSTLTGTGTQNGGVVSAYGSSVGPVGAVITAEATDSNGSIATATANVGCPLVLPNPTANPPTPGSCNENIPQLLSTLTVYNEGLNPNTPEAGGNWLITAPSATGTPAVINCGPGAGAGKSVCTATYPLGTIVTLTAPARTGVSFGGWSSNCFNTGTITQAGPNTCTIDLSASDATVGAIFN